MASEEMEISQMLAKAKKIFDKLKDKVNMKNYKKVLSAIGVVADTDYELEQYFTIVDTDEDGYVNYKDFEATLLAPLIDENEIPEDKQDDGLTVAERSLLTLEKLSEFNRLFDYYKKGKIAHIKEMKEDILMDIKGFAIKLTEFETFYKDFSDKDVVKEDQFFKIYNFYEERVLKKAEVYDKNSSTTDSKSGEVEIEEDNENNDAYQYLEEVIIGEDVDTGKEEDNDKDPEVSLQDIIDHIIDTNTYVKMGQEQLSKIFNKIKVKVDQVNTKIQKMEKKSKKYKNANDVLKNEKEYFQKKVNDLKKTNEDLKEAKYKLECDVEDLMKFEQDFHRMVRQSEEKDVEIMKLEDEVEEFKRKVRSLEFKQKSDNEFIGGTLTKDGLLDRIRNLELELGSYKNYVAMSLPTNKDFTDVEERLSIRQRQSTKVDLIESQEIESLRDPSVKQTYNSATELSKLIDDLSEQNKKLSEGEQKALAKFEKEYQRKLRLIEETEKVKVDLENRLALIMMENEALLKENQWRKEYNISNAKEIEGYLKDIKILERKIQELENESTNWKFKYENQEFIKKNAQYNPQFQKAYIDIVSQNKTEDLYKGRLSQVVNVRAGSMLTNKIKSRAAQGTMIVRKPIAKINEENEEEEKSESKNDDDEDDNLANDMEENELGEFEDIDQPDFGALDDIAGLENDHPFDQNPYNDGVIRASQLDNERFTLINKDRSSHINIGVVKRDFKKTNLDIVEEDDYYDPIKDKLKELKSQTNINKDKVIEILGANREEEQDESEEEPEQFIELKQEIETQEEPEPVIEEKVFEEKEEVKEVPTKVEPTVQKIQDKLRATIAFVSKSYTKSVETQTISKVEEVKIDDSKAFVIYNISESPIIVKEDLRPISQEPIGENQKVSIKEMSNNGVSSEEVKDEELTTKNNIISSEIKSDETPFIEETKTSVAIQSEFKISKTPINEIIVDHSVSIEGETQEVHKSEEQPASLRMRSNKEVVYINDSVEAFTSGEVGRVMMKVHCIDGPTMLIDKGKHKIIDHQTTETQTDKVEVVEKIEVKPVAQAAENTDDGDESSDMEGEDLAEDEEKDLFKKLDSRQKELGIIEEEEDDGDTIKIRNKKTEKEIQDEKKIQEISDKLKSKLDTQVRMSQLGGKGQGFLRDQSIINRISKIKNFDFLGLRSKDNKYFKRVTKILERYSDKANSEGSECFTEYIKKIDTDFKEHKRKIMITRSAVYQLSKNFSVVNRVPLETIKGMTLIKKSATLIAIHCPGSYDHLIEIIRRTELVMFLMHMFDVRKLTKPKIYYADGLKTKTSGKNKVPENKILKFDPAAKQNVGKDNFKLMTHLTSINFIFLG